MKILSSLLSVLIPVVVLSSVPAQSAQVTLNSEVRVRSFYSNNLTDAHRHNHDKDPCPGPDGTLDQSCDDQESFNDIRFRVKMTATEGVGSGVMMVDLFSGEGRDVSTFGGASGTAETGNWRLGEKGFGGSLTAPLVREAYLRVTLPVLTAQAGRQSIQFGHGLLLDDTVDAIIVAIPTGPVGITLGGAKLLESDDSTASNIDSDLYFTHFSWTMMPDIVTALFVTVLEDRGPGLTLNGVCQATTGIPPAFQRCVLSDLGDGGLRLLAAGWAFDVRKERYQAGLEFNILRGSIRSHVPTALNPDEKDLNLRGMNGLVRIGGVWSWIGANLTGIYASGQDPKRLNKININSISPNFVLGNILVNNEMDTDRDGGGIGGLTAVRLGLSRNIWREAEAEVAVIWARLTERPAPGIDPDLGWEVDLNSSVPVDAHLVWTAGVGYLFSGSAWEGLYGDPKANDDMIKVFSKFVFGF